MTQTHTIQARNSDQTNTPENTNVGRKAGEQQNGARSTMQSYRAAQTMYDRLTGPQMIMDYASFARQAASVSGIITRISNETGIPITDILSKCRTRPVAHARQDAMLEIRERLGWPLKRIGKLFGRDHTTVMHGLQAAAERNAT